MKRALPSGLELDDDPARIDVAAVHQFISEESYWALGRPYETMELMVREAARVVGLYDGEAQVGFCRAVRCSPNLFYLADVYVLPRYRGRKLGVELVVEMIDHGPYADDRWFLHTSDAHGLYRRLGFTDPSPKMLERNAT